MSQATAQPDTDPLVDALRRKVKAQGERIDELEAQNDELLDRLLALEQRIPEPSRLDFEDMDRPDKVTVLRQKLRDTAGAMNGKAAFTYKDVITAFDGHPSPGHAYDLMEDAKTDGGFEYGTSPEGTKRLTYDASKV